ncbi:MAG TPA: polysaccharide deacetylase family protein, partial [Bacteroidia bacterium]|nr:polysaccharide deacetylase family protein [Bacteroidia bacterium]
MNAFTIDFEDWYQGVELPYSDWPKYEKRVEIGFYKIFEMLNQKNIKATWFTLGWVAQNYPHLIKELHNAGHELASHGYKHDLAYKLTPEMFKEDVSKTK